MLFEVIDTEGISVRVPINGRASSKRARSANFRSSERSSLGLRLSMVADCDQVAVRAVDRSGGIRAEAHDTAVIFVPGVLGDPDRTLV